MKPYQKLRGELKGNDIDQAYLAQMLKRGNHYITQRMNGHAPWSQDEMYFVLKELNLPFDQVHIYFPPNGVALPEKKGSAFTRLRLVAER